MPCIEPLEFLFEGREDLVVAEIGVEKGDSAIHILEKFDIKKYYGIDPFENYGKFYNGLFDKEKFGTSGDEIHQEVIHKLFKYMNAELIRDYAHNAVNYIEDNSLDICWIDGNHAYDYVLQDLMDWYPKVKVGGIICGDDAHLHEVVKAVKDFFKEGYDVFFGKRSWFTVKWGDMYW